MTVELKVPEVGESITEVQIGDWLKSEGEAVSADDPLVVIETDKVTVELPAPSAGVFVRRLKEKGETAAVGEVIGYMETAEAAAQAAPVAAADGTAAPASQEGAQAPARTGHVMPAAKRVLAERGIDAGTVQGTGPGGRVTKQDARQAPAAPAAPAPKQAPAPAPEQAPAPAAGVKKAPAGPAAAPRGGRHEEVVPMTPLRRRIAARLVQAQQEAAILTTFNEVDMSAVMALRKEHQASFQERYGIKLGFMSFFVKAVIDAAKLVPQVNAEIRDGSIVYRDYYDVGVAVGGGKGLVVPVIRDAQALSFAEVELAIADLSARARDNKLALEELQGGTFTISNGGIYGSLLSTPILNPPQSGILGLHAIQDRPVVRDGQVVVRPMMYVALSYDHRLVDGREAVTFLKRIKDCVEAPARMLLEV